MFKKKYSALLVLMFFIGPVAASFSASKNADKATSLTITSEQFGRVCIQHDAPTVEALKSGRKWAVLSVTAFSPPGKNKGLRVDILSDDNNKKSAISHFAVHSQKAFNAKKGTAPHKFLLPLKRHPTLITNEQTCFHIAFHKNEKETKKGWAEINVKIVQPPHLK